MTIAKKISKTIAETTNSKIFTLLLYFSAFLLVFSLSFGVPGDPDLGWHLRYGQEILQTSQISTKDTFSHTFYGEEIGPNEWGLEYLSYFIYKNFSFAGYAFFYSVITLLAFVIPLFIFKSSPLKRILLLFFSLLGSSSVLAAGGRPQESTLLFLSLLIFLLYKFDEKKQKIYLLIIPFLFLIWANIHPGFLLGILYLSIFIFSELFFLIVLNFKKINLITTIKEYTFPLLIIPLSYLMTNFRPQAGNSSKQLFLDIVGVMLLPVNLAEGSSDRGNVRTTITEWLPPIFFDVGGIIFLLAIVFSIAMFYLIAFKRNKLNYLKNLSILSFFIYFATLARRNVPLFLLIQIPINLSNFNLIEIDKRLLKASSYIKIITLVLLTYFSVQNIAFNSQKLFEVNGSVGSYCKVLKCPYEAVEFIKKEKPEGNMINAYNWGGFLIWQLPEYQVFIDGRVPGNQIYKEYLSIESLDDGWQEKLDKYNVKWLIYQKNNEFALELKDKYGWEQIYIDEIALILRRK